MAHFKFSNEYCSLITGPDVLKLKLATSIGVIWRWYERQGLVFIIFQEKIGPTYCQNVCHFEISNEYCGLITGPDVLKLKLATSIGVIWRWYERQGLVFIIFQEKVGPTYGWKYVVDLDPTLECQIFSIYCPSGPS